MFRVTCLLRAFPFPALDLFFALEHLPFPKSSCISRKGEAKEDLNGEKGKGSDIINIADRFTRNHGGGTLN